MKNNIIIFILASLMLSFFSCKTKNTENKNSSITTDSKTDYSNFANPLMGTDSDFSLSNGNTYPAIAQPWGMNFWTPMTSKAGDGWTYKYDDKKITGFKQTHQPSPWINDYAAFAIMPQVGLVSFKEDERASWFSHKTENVKPYYYSTYLADYDTKVELTPTERAVIFNITFPKSDSAWVLLDAFDGGSMVKIIPEENKIIGYCKNNHGGVPDNFCNYFVAEFNKPFYLKKTFKEGKTNKNDIYSEGKRTGAAVGFKTKKSEIITIKIASSFISQEQAELNLKREIGVRSFAEIKQQNKEIWNNELGKFSINGNNIDDVRTFYSTLYRVLLFPRKFYEINKENKIVHYSPYNGKVLSGYMFTDNGFWDTFRAVFPFFSWMYPELDSHIMEGLVNTYNESGWLPEWASPGHRSCMIGSNSAVIIADAILKDIKGFDADKLYEAMIKNTKGNHPKVSSVGRYGAEYYNKLGYIPYNVGINENTARTLEYAFADYCIWKTAQLLNKTKEDIELFKKRSQNYKNVYDKTVGWMRGKNEDGTFQSPFNPFKWGDAFTEGNSLHYTWSVFHDIKGLINLMGGKKNFVAKLDSIFTMPPIFDNSYYGFTIHEIREMQIVGMGNYAHGNQPIQHMLYLYNYAGQPWKTQARVRKVLKKLYTPTPDGYCGDEDNGQTSAWYVFSSLGFYPVTPASNNFAIGSPLFNDVTINLPNGKKLHIKAENNSDKNVYIKEIKYNGKIINENYFTFEQLTKGGEIIFKMSNKPNKSRGTEDSDAPYSMTK